VGLIKRLLSYELAEFFSRKYFKSPSPQTILIIEEAAKAPSQGKGEIVLYLIDIL